MCYSTRRKLFTIIALENPISRARARIESTYCHTSFSTIAFCVLSRAAIARNAAKISIKSANWRRRQRCTRWASRSSAENSAVGTFFLFGSRKKLDNVLQAVYGQQSALAETSGRECRSLHKLPVHLNSPPGTVTILLHVVLLSDTPHPLSQETSRLQTRIIIPSRLPVPKQPGPAFESFVRKVQQP